MTEQYYQSNKQEIIDRASLWNKTNLERRREIARLSWQKNKHKLDKAKLKRANLKHDHGITLEQYNQMLTTQNNKCAICELVFSNEKKTTKPHVDHCHTTGKIRALLCHGCNVAIGNFKDSIDIVNKAAIYLKDHATRD